MAIIVDNLGFSYRTGKRVHEVLQGVSLTANDGELTAILGANGAGKSTLLKCILSLLKGYEGSIRIGLSKAAKAEPAKVESSEAEFKGNESAEASKLSAAQLSRYMAYIPQLHYQSFAYSVLDMVLMGTVNQLTAVSSPGAGQREIAEEALEKFEVAHLADQDFTTLSGGEQQLVLMARAYAQKSKIWILDEPTANLDYGNQIKVQEKLKKMASQGYTILMTTHNPEQTFMFADKVAALKDGRIIACGSPGEVMDDALIKELYGIETTADNIYGGKVRIFAPKSVCDRE